MFSQIETDQFFLIASEQQALIQCQRGVAWLVEDRFGGARSFNQFRSAQFESSQCAVFAQNDDRVIDRQHVASTQIGLPFPSQFALLQIDAFQRWPTNGHGCKSKQVISRRDQIRVLTIEQTDVTPWLVIAAVGQHAKATQTRFDFGAADNANAIVDHHRRDRIGSIDASWITYLMSNLPMHGAVVWIQTNQSFERHDEDQLPSMNGGDRWRGVCVAVVGGFPDGCSIDSD